MSKIQALQANTFSNASASPGDFFHVPLPTIHREIDPSPSEGKDLILFLHGTGLLSVNVDDPEQA
jgi:hypothetical protein